MVIGITDTDRRWRTMSPHIKKPGQRSRLRPKHRHGIGRLSCRSRPINDPGAKYFPDLDKERKVRKGKALTARAVETAAADGNRFGGFAPFS